MKQFVKPIDSVNLDLDKVSELCASLESRSADEIQKAVAYLDDHPDYRPIIEGRYLNFIRARLRDPSATLAQIESVSIPDEVRSSFMKLGSDGWRFEGSGGDEVFSLLVDLCGSLIASYADLEAYLAYVSDIQRREGQVDMKYSAIWQLPDVFAPCTRPELCEDGWFGGMLSHVLKTRLEGIAFDHSNAGIADDAMFLDEFLFFVLGHQEEDVLIWDFFQSTPLKFPSVVYPLNYSWQLLGPEAEFVLPEAYNDAYEVLLWVENRPN